MAYIVVYDACVLHPAPLRDLLVRIARTGVVRARWSEQILDECFRRILRQRPDLEPGALRRTRWLMKVAVPDCLVSGFEGLVSGLELPDPDDRHVLAAAIRAGAHAIVTANLKDFPRDALAPYRVVAIHPDAFVSSVIDVAPRLVLEVLSEQAAALRRPPLAVENLLQVLQGNGLVRSVAMLRTMRSSSRPAGEIS
jgi:hypothetical protein